MRKAIFCLLLLSASLLCFELKSKAAENNLEISEIMYDYPGADDNHEWVEIHNLSSDNIFVDEIKWKFFDGSKHSLNLQQGTTTIPAGGFFILTDDGEQFLLDYPHVTSTIFDTIMNLSNSSSSISLIFNEEDYISANYDSLWGAKGNGFSLEKIDDVWQESSSEGGSPGRANIIPKIEILSPEANISCPESLLANEEWIFSASGSSDPQNLPLIFSWNFCNEQISTSTAFAYFFPEAGFYEVELIVSNGEAEDMADCSFEVTAPEINHWEQIIISEFLPNPIGSDDEEWIELYNLGPEEVDLANFKLQDNSARIFTLNENDDLDLILGANEYLVLAKEITGISLNNSGGDSVKLFNPEGELLEEINYVDSAREDESFARQNDNFLWTSLPTPGADNIFIINQPPQAKISLNYDKLAVGKEIIFSAQESYDPDNDDLEYKWDFGDGKSGSGLEKKHKYSSAGDFLVRLTVSDEEGVEDSAELLITILEAEEEEKNTEEIIQAKPINFTQDDLLISEFIPNPIGSDDEEWIELYNASFQDINLAGWQLDDSEGGSKPYVFTEEKIIPADSFLVISCLDSKITLNNSNDAVRLLEPDGELWQEVIYEKIPEGESQALDLVNNEWFVSEVPSPGEVNMVLVEEESIYGIDEIKEFAKGEEVIVQGIALQNVGSSVRSFYAAGISGQEIDYDNVAEIYFSAKDFPEIQRGDLIEVKGETSRNGFLPRIKIKNKDDIIVNGIDFVFTLSETISTEDLDEGLLGAFINIEGVVVKKSGQNIYLASDKDEDWQVRIYTDFSTKDLEIKKGNQIEVAGILTETDSGYKLLVLKKEDLLVSQVLGESISVDNGEVSSGDFVTTTNEISPENRQKQVKNILIFLIIGAIISGIIYSIKLRREKLKAEK